MPNLPQIIEGFQRSYADRILTIDSHTQGEPTRLVVGGIGPLPGATMQAKCEYFKTHFDHLRRLLTREPRGHRDILAAVMTEPVSTQSAFGLFYMDARRYPFLCGHATIGAVVSLVQTGAVKMPEGESTIWVDTPSGPLAARTRIEGGRAVAVGIRMVPSFVYATDRSVEPDGWGEIPVDFVCVGGFFAMVDAGRIGLSLDAGNRPRLIELGMAVIEAANKAFKVRHPRRPEVGSIDVAEFYSRHPHTPHRGRSVVVYGEAHMDRSPCGTGTTAKMTLLHAGGELDLHQTYTNTGPLGTAFEGMLVEKTMVGEFEAVVGEIRSSAHITGMHEFVVDADDPLPEGFLL